MNFANAQALKLGAKPVVEAGQESFCLRISTCKSTPFDENAKGKFQYLAWKETDSNVKGGSVFQGSQTRQQKALSQFVFPAS